ASSHSTRLRWPASDMASIWSHRSLRPRKVSWIGLNCRSSSYLASNQALSRWLSAWTCSASAAAAFWVAPLPLPAPSSRLQEDTARGRARARAMARVLRAMTGRTVELSWIGTTAAFCCMAGWRRTVEVVMGVREPRHATWDTWHMASRPRVPRLEASPTGEAHAQAHAPHRDHPPGL